MNREELIEKACRALGDHFRDEPSYMTILATCIIDAILPEVTTVEELEALPCGTLLKQHGGDVWEWYPLLGADCLSEDGEHGLYSAEECLARGPLTVVCRP